MLGVYGAITMTGIIIIISPLSLSTSVRLSKYAHVISWSIMSGGRSEKGLFLFTCVSIYLSSFFFVCFFKVPLLVGEFIIHLLVYLFIQKTGVYNTSID